MRASSLLVIDPSVERAEREGARRAAGDWPGPVRVVRPVLEPGAPLDERLLEDTAAVIVLGSAASVHDDRPWLVELAALLAPVVRGEREMPLLGICFGHQLVAHLAGATVADLHHDRRKCLGVRRTRVEGASLARGRRALTVVASHRETVVEVPRGFRRAGTRRESPIDILEHIHRPVFGVQFHPEAGAEFLRGVGLDPAGVSAAALRDGGLVLAAFRRIALERARSR